MVKAVSVAPGVALSTFQLEATKGVPLSTV